MIQSILLESAWMRVLSPSHDWLCEWIAGVFGDGSRDINERTPSDWDWPVPLCDHR